MLGDIKVVNMGTSNNNGQPKFVGPIIIGRPIISQASNRWPPLT